MKLHRVFVASFATGWLVTLAIVAVAVVLVPLVILIPDRLPPNVGRSLPELTVGATLHCGEAFASILFPTRFVVSLNC